MGSNPGPIRAQARWLSQKLPKRRLTVLSLVVKPAAVHESAVCGRPNTAMNRAPGDLQAGWRHLAAPGAAVVDGHHQPAGERDPAEDVVINQAMDKDLARPTAIRVGAA
jgi:hypothetical protein